MLDELTAKQVIHLLPPAAELRVHPPADLGGDRTPSCPVRGSGATTGSACRCWLPLPLGEPAVGPEHLDPPPGLARLPAVRKDLEHRPRPYTDAGQEWLEAVG